MAIILNDNIKINAGKPSESKYLNTGNTAYISESAVCAQIPISERYVGLTVLVDTGATNVEYWFQEDVSTLVEKKFDSVIPTEDFVTGATNIGFFSGFTGIQTLPINNLVDNNYDGNYNSLYNWFFRGSDGAIHVGTPDDGTPKRGYFKSAYPPKSWVWNDYTGGSELEGWILIDGNINDQLGTFQTGVPYYNGTTTFPYTATTFVTGSAYNNASNVVIDTVIGSTTTGDTLTIGGPVYAFQDHNDLHLRTLKTASPVTMNITYDEAFVYISGATAVLTAANTGTTGTNTAGVYDSQTDNTLYFRRIVGSGDTQVSQVGNDVVFYSTGGTGSINVQNVGSGAGEVYSGKTGTTMLFRTILGSGDTSVITSGDTIVVNTISGGEYNLASPSVIPLGGICSGTVLTGKSSFELWEELLVPELEGTITAPSLGIGLSASGLYEIDCNLSQTVTGTFNRGCINPQYCSLSDKRSGLPNAYDFTGTGMPSGFQTCTNLIASNVNASYDVVIGNQAWTVQTRYDCGDPALGSKSTQYCAALVSGCTSVSSSSIEGVYPLYGTTVSISTLTKQTLQNMCTATNVCMNVVTESGGNKQKFEVPCAWLGAPTSRPLVGVCQWNTVSSQWEYPGGSAPTSLAVWTASACSETIQGNPVGYCLYTYNGVDRASVCIRLVF